MNANGIAQSTLSPLTARPTSLTQIAIPTPVAAPTPPMVPPVLAAKEGNPKNGRARHGEKHEVNFHKAMKFLKLSEQDRRRQDADRKEDGNRMRGKLMVIFRHFIEDCQDHEMMQDESNVKLFNRHLGMNLKVNKPAKGGL